VHSHVTLSILLERRRVMTCERLDIEEQEEKVMEEEEE
jgi:hypothetical protein